MERDFFFAITTPGLEDISAKEIANVLQTLNNSPIQPIVQPSFLSGVVYFCCAKSIPITTVIGRLRSVERVCSSIAVVENLPKTYEAINSLIHFPFYWDDYFFQRACEIWEECLPIIHSYDDQPFDQQQFSNMNYAPVANYSESCEQLFVKSSEAAFPHAMNQPFSFFCNNENKEELNQSNEPSINLTNEIAPPPLPSVDYWRNNFDFDKNSEYNNRIKGSIFEGKKTPLFRVTCDREGNHEFKSRHVAGAIGEGVVTRYKWEVSLKQFEMNIWEVLRANKLAIGITLTPEAKTLHKRSRSIFGKTSLRPRF